MFGEVACLVWAARVFIAESTLNFSVILLMWIVLFFSFLVSCNFFSGIVNDVGVVLAVMNQLMFATLPLVSAALLSWFLCIEVPSLDLLLCFNAVYFVYMLFLGRPRIVSLSLRKGKHSPTSPAGSMQTYLLPAYLLIIMYIIPIVMTIFMHIAIHHNVLSTSHTRVTNFLLSVLVPALLMTYCAHKQLTSGAASFHAQDDQLVENLPKFLEGSTYVLSCLMIYCIQSHPMLDELKSFSDLSDEMAGYAIMTAVFLVFAAFAIHQFCKKQTAYLIEQSENMNSDSAAADARKRMKFVSILASVCIGGANALMTVVIGLPEHAVGVSVVGAMSLAEYYLHSDWSAGHRAILLCIASLYSALAASSFIKMALGGILYQFHWHVDATMPEFTTVINLLVPVAVLLPTMLGSNVVDSAAYAGDLMHHGLPRTDINSAASSSGSRYIGNVVFEWVFPVVTVIVAAAELMIREQVHTLVAVFSRICFKSFTTVTRFCEGIDTYLQICLNHMYFFLKKHNTHFLLLIALLFPRTGRISESACL